MPLYEYECEACHRRTEKIQRFSDAELTVCPHCGGTLARTITAPAIQFKGAGWYKDLYSSAKPVASGASGEGAGTPAPSNGEGSGGTKTEAAPAAAPASAPASASTASTGSSTA